MPSTTMLRLQQARATAKALEETLSKQTLIER